MVKITKSLGTVWRQITIMIWKSGVRCLWEEVIKNITIKAGKGDMLELTY